MYYFQYLLFMLPALLVSIVAQARVQSTFRKYSQIRNRQGLTGADAARRVLSLNGISNVQVEFVNGNLTDHYDPRSNVIRLSSSVYGVDSVAAVGVAAHEAGHAPNMRQDTCLLNCGRLWCRFPNLVQGFPFRLSCSVTFSNMIG